MRGRDRDCIMSAKAALGAQQQTLLRNPRRGRSHTMLSTRSSALDRVLKVADARRTALVHSRSRTTR